MKTICVMNRKGGVGKTTTACNLAYYLARLGHTMLIDLDGQGNAAYLLTGENQAEKQGAAELMQGGVELEDVLLDVREDYKTCTGDLRVLPGGEVLFTLNRRLRRPDALSEAVESSGVKFDYCVVDCPPEVNMAVLNALYIADRVLVPVTGSQTSLDGAMTILRELGENSDILGRPEVYLMASMSVHREELRERLKPVAKLCGCMVLPDGTTWSRKAAEADERRELLAVYSPHSQPAKQYRKIAERVSL